jgi:aspartyl-tRNA(Asn)/glutamyl-tRNA(Gln) amidotransferase subunit A
MQVVGRPFDDATVLRVAHAYERATPWRTRRPRLDHDAEFSTALPPIPDPEPAQIDAATRDRVAVACRAAGLTFSDRQFEMACAAAPYVIAMTGRLYRDRAYNEEPANIFQFAG